MDRLLKRILPKSAIKVSPSSFLCEKSPFLPFPLNFDGEFAGIRGHNFRTKGAKMANFVLPRSKAFCIEGLVLTLFCLLAASCNLPPGRDDEKGFLTIVLPGAEAPDQNSTAGARAAHLPEPITGNMSYTLEFDNPDRSFSVGPTREKVIAVELEPGFWDITITAHYGDVINDAAIAALDKQAVEIQAGQANSVSFTMDAEEFLTPDRVEGPNQDMSITTSDTPPVLSVAMHTSTAFSGIDGWTDYFSYQWRYEDEDGNSIDVGSPGSFSASSPGSETLDCAVNNDAAGTFQYYIKISNSYTYVPPEGGTATTDSATKNFHVAEVIVKATLIDIEIVWPKEEAFP
jgi:hypothetical protein